MNDNLSSNKYKKVLLIAQRTKQLQNGAQPRVRLIGEKPSRIARVEVEQGLIKTRGRAGQEEAQPTPELTKKGAKK